MKTKSLSTVGLLFGLLLFGNVYSCLSGNYTNNGNSVQLLCNPQNDSINPVDVFEQVWQVLNTNYPYFDQRGIDWNALHKVFSAKISTKTTDEELFNTLCSLLGLFNDGHINLDNGKKSFCSGVNYKMEDFSWKLVRDKYLKGSFKSSPDSLIYYGWIDNDLAYLRIRRFPGYEVVDKYFDPIIQELSKAKGIIVEIRGNSGGTDSGAEAIANRFADRKRLYEKVYWRMGLKRDFSNLTFHYIQPKGAARYTGPVVLLQNKHSESASECFALAMRVIPNVTSVGEITGGCFASYYPEKLINGWSVTLPYSYATDQNGFCWEGLGVPPDLCRINTKEDIDARNDKVLELAIDILKIGGHYGKEAQGSLQDLRISLVYQFLESSKKNGVKAAVSEFEKMHKNNPEGVYLSIQELMYNVGILFSENKLDAATAILELGVKSFPDDISTMFFLAMSYEKQGQPDKAKALYSKIIKYKAYYPWEKGALAKAKESFK